MTLKLKQLPHTKSAFTFVIIPTLIFFSDGERTDIGLMWLNWHLQLRFGKSTRKSTLYK